MKIVAKSLYGLEQVLADELNRLGCRDITVANRAVIFNGDLKTLYKVNYMSRTALSFLVIVKEFRIESADDLYRKGLKVNWTEFMGLENTFSVTSVVNSEIFQHSGFAALKLKDAVADHFRNRTGRRPDVDTEDPDIIINLHVSHNQVTISLDSSGLPLYKRGYRTEQGIAPLNEVLAAGMLYLSGWDTLTEFTDPMCGSGTLPIEAALIASDTPSGKFRKSFGFQKWNNYNEQLYSETVDSANSAIKVPDVRINASDISETAVVQSAKNIESAGVEDFINLGKADFKSLKPASETGFLIINPPYGERMRVDEENELYSIIGTTLKHSFNGHVAWLISSNREAVKHIGLKPSKKYNLFNGSLECSFLKYELYQGSRRGGKN
jgi:putative N6-adenine-specific DNA methylase